MRKLTRILTAGLTAAMLLASLALGASAASKFSDVSAKDETLTKAVALLEGLGVTKGTSDDTFGTNDPVTRQQMAAFIYRLMNRGKSVEGGDNTTDFEDLYDDTYYSYVSWAHNMGVIKGISATEFDPDGTIVLQDAYTMIVRALGYEKTTTLSYPFDYIDIAESTDVDLADGLSSSISYEKELTRGNVAVLLYNAFYAEMGESEEQEVERKIGKGDKQKLVLETKTVFPKLCEKIYDVVETEFQVRETTHYAFNDSKDSTVYKATEDSYGDGTMLLVATDDSDVPSSFYTNLEKLGLTGNADDYILSTINVYYTYDKEDAKVDQIFVATPLIEKTSSTSATLAKRTPTGERFDYENCYTVNSSTGLSEYARYSGEMTVGGKKLYFYDAPYNFLKPSYAGCETEDDKYEVRNEDNTKLINLKATDLEKGLYSYYLEDVNDTFEHLDGYGTSNNKAFMKYFYLLRTGGLYAMDIIDADGDGRYEYMWYKPATLGKLDMDDEYEFCDIDEHKTNETVKVAAKDATKTPKNIPTIYGYGATFDGAKGTTYRDGDFIAAYLNGDANYIYLFATGSAKKGTVASVDRSNGIIKFGDGQTFQTPWIILYVQNWHAYSPDTGKYSDWHMVDSTTGNSGKLMTFDILNREVTFYYLSAGGRNNIVHYEIGEATGTYSGEELLIPLETKTELSRDENNNKYQYLKVWVDGAEKYVPVDVESCYPLPTANVDGTYTFNNTVTEADGGTYDVYIGKLCTYSVDSKGVYTIHGLLHGEDDEGACDHIKLYYDADEFFDEDEVTQSATDLDNVKVLFTKDTSKYYTLTDSTHTEYSMLGTKGSGKSDDNLDFEQADITGATFIIREITLDEDGEEENEFHIYKGTEFPGSVESELTNVQYVYTNDGDSTRRIKLVLFYAEVADNEELEFVATTSNKKTDWRIVKSSTPTKVESKDFRMSYDLYNPNTGKVEEGVLGVVSKNTASELAKFEGFDVGAVVKLNSLGQVNDKKEADGVINAATNENLVFLTDVDVDSMTLEIELVNDADEDHFTDEKDGNFYTYYTISDNVVITIMKLETKSDLSTAEISTLTLEELAAGKNAIKAYNSKIIDSKGKLSTKYGEYVKAYITFDNPKNSKDDFPTVDTITVIVNDNEPEEYLKTK